ncbi:hypothetical protein N658DRAFT_160161 [Parathielavia hyrcaniae]|uniref:tRNA-intron lyase n=1 Tax=Parathielavia hyrcaniae TaxID=113614 RepID=A0AAN6PX14_9PEZI|nr:hypothetical protein N658DRAFT_160161 [Parathielavia hyrcaniae]
MSKTATVVTTSSDGDAIRTVGLAASPATSPSAGAPKTAAEPASLPRVPLNEVYALPAPIRTFPLPTFYPNNPISLLHLAYAWLSQVFRPPPREPSVVHTGIWDPETRSVHVRDDASVRALWEQGFYGKGSLSRSEPNWLKRELARRGSPEGKTVSEARTELRREERRLAKWERAKAELGALERQRLAEAAAHAAATKVAEGNGSLYEPVDVKTSLSLQGSVQPGAVQHSPANAVAESATESPDSVGQAEVVTTDIVLACCPLHPKPPVGPAELLALPNSLAQLNGLLHGSRAKPLRQERQWKAPVGPAELLLLPNSHAELISKPVNGLTMFETGSSALGQPQLQPYHDTSALADCKPCDGQLQLNGAVNGHAVKASPSDDSSHQVGQMDKVSLNGIQPNVASNGDVSPPFLRSDESISSSAQEADGSISQPMKRRKSVRFSPTVQSTTFVHSDPPSPSRSSGVSAKSAGSALTNGELVGEPDAIRTLAAVPPGAPESSSHLVLNDQVELGEIRNKEHFQLAPEEAFFLVFALGALMVVDPATSSPISTEHLLSLFRSYSYFPPRPAGSALGPDDPFLVNYAVYHHFRSLGWVPRHGIKFGVDWIIYQRGPVFDHSEFGIMVVPAYSDPAWEGHEHEEPRRSWSWLMGVNRVLSHVLKSLVLVYVDIPAPNVFEEEMHRGGIASALKRYTIREVMVRRFSVNRNR